MLLALKNIRKKFGEIEVLKGIDLIVSEGEIIGLVGENGAGKSTLMNILGGIFEQTDGQMSLENNEFNPQNAKIALSKGVAFIHQELNLFDNLTIVENVFISNFPRKKILGFNFLDLALAKQKTAELLKKVGLNIPLTTLLADLTPAQKQMVEIAKALNGTPKLIIFDEPTTSLTKFETEKLFELMAQLKAQSIAMIYISHNLEDVIQLSDKISIMRDGMLVKEFLRKDGFDLNKIIFEMIGRELNTYYPKRTNTIIQETVLKVNNLEDNYIKKVTFELKKGEVLGFYGLVGAGRSEMARLIFGLNSLKNGTVTFKNEEIRTLYPNFWIKNGLGFVTEDRRDEGLLLENTIEKNIGLASLNTHKNGFLNRINFKNLNLESGKLAQKTNIKTHSLKTQHAGTLSGGNQQKVVLSKWLMTQPDVLIIDEPTKGIDVGAKHEIYSLINDMVSEGKSILMISSELEELIGMSDRILVMNEGAISSEFEKNNFDRNQILAAAIHKN